MTRTREENAADLAREAATRKARKPTKAQRRALENLAAGRSITYGLRGNSAHGGFTNTLTALLQRKWITSGPDYQLTDAGLAALETKA